MGASVKRTTKTKKKKLKLFYEITSGKPYIVRTLKYDISDKKIAEYLRNDSTQSMLREGMLFDVNVLDAERQRITDYLLCNGYYKFNKDYITYTADTARNTHQVDLTLHLLARADARAAKDWSRADAVRDGLCGLGFVIEDTPQGARVTYEG